MVWSLSLFKINKYDKNSLRSTLQPVFKRD